MDIVNNRINKCILVTGASYGVGYAITRQLSAEGHIVFSGARDIEPLFGLLNEVGTIPVELDITDPGSVYGCLDLITDHYGYQIDVLINCDKYQAYRVIEETRIQGRRSQYELGALGLSEIVNAVIPIMINQRGGRIINVITTIDTCSTPLEEWGAASNNSLQTFSECLQFELAPYNIDVTAIESVVIEAWLDEISESCEMPDNRYEYAAFSPMPKTSDKTILESILSMIRHFWRNAVAVEKPKNFTKFNPQMPVHNYSTASTNAAFNFNSVTKRIISDFDDI